MPGRFVARRLGAGVVAAGLLVMAGTGTVSAHAPHETCPGQSTVDLWDVSQGAVVEEHSGLRAGTPENMLGAADSSPEEGTTFFRDDQADGFVHFIEWSVPQPVTIQSFLFVTAHDHNSLQRSITAFRLFAVADDASPIDLYEFAPELPYGDGDQGNYLFLCDDVSAPVEASRFRAEFVQNGGFSFPGTRAIELDGYDVPLADLLPTPTAPPATEMPSVAPTPEATEVSGTPTPAPATEPPATAGPSPSDTGDAGGATILIGVAALIALVAIGGWFVLGSRRRRGSEPPA